MSLNAKWYHKLIVNTNLIKRWIQFPEGCSRATNKIHSNPLTGILRTCHYLNCFLVMMSKKAKLNNMLVPFNQTLIANSPSMIALLENGRDVAYYDR